MVARGVVSSLLSLSLLLSLLALTTAQITVTLPVPPFQRRTISGSPKANLTNVFVIQYVGAYGQVIAKLGAMTFAVNRINSDFSILPNIRLEINGIESPNDKKSTIMAAIGAAQSPDGCNVMIAGETYTETQYVQYMASSYPFPQINPTSIEGTLYSASSNPTLLNMLPSSLDQQNVVVTLMKKWRIKSALIILTNNQYGNEFNNLQYNAHAVANNMSFQILSIASTPTQLASEMTQKVALAAQYIPQYRYVICHGSAFSIATFITNLGKANLTGPQYLYILTHQTTVGIVETDAQAITGARPYLDGAIGIAAKFQDNNEFSRQVLSEWSVANTGLYGGARTQIRSAWFAFDTIYAYAYALDAMLKDGYTLEGRKSGGVDNQKTNITGNLLLSYLLRSNFTGVSGRVNFDSVTRNRPGFWDIINFNLVTTKKREESDSTATTLVPSYRAVACYDCTELYNQTSEFVFWGGNTTVPPPRIVCAVQDCLECTDDGAVCRTCEQDKLYFQGLCVGQCPNNTYVSGSQCIAVDAPTLAPTVYKYRKNIPAISIALGAIAGVGILFSLFAAVMIFAFWRQFSKHGSFYCAVIISGVFVAYVAPLVILPAPTDTLCLAFPWFLGVGFTLVYGCLFIKAWALFTVYRRAEKLKRTKMTPLYIVARLFLYMLVEIVFLIVWSNVDRPKAEWKKMVDDTYQLQCVTKHPTFWAIFAAMKGIWLLFGASLSVLTRHVAKEFNESKSIAYSIYNIIAMLIIAIPLAVALNDIPGGLIIIEVGVIVIALTFTIFSLFYPVWYGIFFPNKLETMELARTNSGFSRNTSSAQLHSGGSRNNSRAESRNSRSGSAASHSPRSVRAHRASGSGSARGNSSNSNSNSAERDSFSISISGKSDDIHISDKESLTDKEKTKDIESPRSETESPREAEENKVDNDTGVTGEETA